MKFLFRKKHKLRNSINKFLKNRKFIISLIIVFVFLTSLGFYGYVRSSALQNLSGYIWESDWVDAGHMEGSTYVLGNPDGIQNLPYEETGGMGWLSLNCISGGNCGAADYGVNIDPDGYLRGYAWSPNYGWLKFGGMPSTDFPSGGGTIADNAKVDWAAPDPKPIKGWARFCSAAANPDTCTGFVANLKNGGWDGKISLSGSSPTYGVFLDTTAGNISGYAWGGNCVGGDGGTDGDCVDANEEFVNVGWIDFSGGGNNALFTPVVSPTVTISATPAAILAGSTTKLSWTGLNIEPGSSACVATGDWNGSKPYPAPAAGVTIGPLPAGVYNYSIQCFGADNTPSNISTVQVTVGSNAVLDFHAETSPVYPPYQTNLVWNALPPGSLHGCVAESGPDSVPPLNIAAVPNWQGGVPDPNTFAPVSVPYNPTNFKLTCKDVLDQDVSSTISVPQGSLPETVTLSSNGVIENPAGSGNYYTTLSWSTINANNCVASGGAGGPPWEGGLGNSGSLSDVPVPAIAPAFTSYILTCTGIYSFEQISAQLNLNEGSGRTFTIKQPLYMER